MKSGGVNSIGSGDLTKVPEGFTDPNQKPADGKDGKPVKRASHALAVLNTEALQAAVQGAMKELPAGDRPYLLGAPMPEMVLGETQGMNGSGAMGAAAAKGAGGGKVSIGSGNDKKEAVMKAMQKKGLDLEDAGIDADDIPGEVMKKLAAKEINLQQAYDMTIEANEEAADDDATKAKVPGAKVGVKEVTPPVKEDAPAKAKP
jgi:hypothetical protein